MTHNLFKSSNASKLIMLGDFNEHYLNDIIKIYSMDKSNTINIRNVASIYEFPECNTQIPCKLTQAPISNKNKDAKDSVNNDEKLDYIILGDNNNFADLPFQEFAKHIFQISESFVDKFLQLNVSAHYPVCIDLVPIEDEFNSGDGPRGRRRQQT